MSPSRANIRRKNTKTKGFRYHVRYRPGGRDSKWTHVAVFGSLSDARACARWVDGELAAGRHPTRDDYFAQIAGPQKVTLRDLADRYEQRPMGDSTRKNFHLAVRRLGALADRDIETITGSDVQAWINRLAEELTPSTLNAYRSIVRRIWDYAEIPDNPFAWSMLRIPTGETERKGDPPGHAAFMAILNAISPRYRDALIVLEGTGFRVIELMHLDIGDVDWQQGRIRTSRSKTRHGIRWVPLTDEVRAVLEARFAPEDRIAGTLVFPGFSDHGLRNAMARACKHAGVAHHSPHDLRRRFTSLLKLAGVPDSLIRDIMGHRKLSTTHDDYTFTLLTEPQERLRALSRAVGRMAGLTGEIEDGGVPVGPQTETSEVWS